MTWDHCNIPKDELAKPDSVAACTFLFYLEIWLRFGNETTFKCTVYYTCTYAGIREQSTIYKHMIKETSIEILNLDLYRFISHKWKDTCRLFCRCRTQLPVTDGSYCPQSHSGRTLKLAIFPSTTVWTREMSHWFCTSCSCLDCTMPHLTDSQFLFHTRNKSRGRF